MENLKQEYKQLTNVDIDEQRRIWDERGKGYYGEYLLFSEIYKYVDEKSKILMNLEIPVDPLHSTEIDLLLIHETGIYVFEAKHYKGTIYGRDSDNTWTQFFKTTANKTFRNPIIQNGYHVRALKSLFPEIPIYSVIVFTNEEVDVRIENDNPYIDICDITFLHDILDENFENNEKVNSYEKVNEIFKSLSKYSPLTESIKYNGKEAPFESWFIPMLDSLKNQKKILKEEKDRTKKQRKILIITTILSVALFVIGSVASFLFTHNYYLNKAEKLEQKYLMIDEIDNNSFDLVDSCINVSEENFHSFLDGIRFQAKLTLLDSNYVFLIGENSKYIVRTSDGQIHEYDMFDRLVYSKSANTLSFEEKISGHLSQINFIGISEISDIIYIKITDISLYDVTGTNLIDDNLELELYSK
ncbi:MAG: NERD domain-containing protein [Oscillospiraceae bacterium]|nr:NERD domain-containing protein [Oscillospiraceae bacterium]